MRGGEVGLVGSLVLGEAHIAVDTLCKLLVREMGERPVRFGCQRDPGLNEGRKVGQGVAVAGICYQTKRELVD